MNSLSAEFNHIKSWSDSLPSMTDLLDEIENNIHSISKPELILPEKHMIFNAFKHCCFAEISAVIIGQDPYHQTPSINGVPTNQAMGLSFSVPQGMKIPPSLRNIYQELDSNINEFAIPTHGNLSSWATQVLLLNSSLTVEHSNPGAHAKTGWGKFTTQIIKALIQREKPIVFLSWGKHAHKITACAENTHHHVIKTSHPSPLGARKSGLDFDAFLGSKCFNKTNKFLEQSGQQPIKWLSILDE